ncbi:MAG: PAS domain S-box protein [Pseudomonadota bacterium]
MKTLQPQTLRRCLYFGAMAALAFVVVGVMARVALRDRDEVIAAAFETATLHARSFEDHLTQSFNVIDLTLAHAAEPHAGEVTAAGSPKVFTAALHQAPYLRSLAILDADGRIVASSNVRDLGRDVALAGFLPAASDSAQLLRVGSPWTGRDFADGRPITAEQPPDTDAPGFLPVSRDVVVDHGRRVTLLAAVNGDFFIHHYSQVLDSAKATVDVLRYDGTLLLSTGAARLPGARQGAALLASRLAQREFGHVEERLEDGRPVLTAYRTSRAHPMVIVVQIDKDQALANWREEALGTMSLVVALLLGAMGLSAWYYLRLEQASGSRAAAETALRASEAQYRNTFDQAAIGIAHATPEGRFLRGNQHLCDMLGYSAEELVCKTIGEITHPDDLAADVILRQRVLAGELPSYRTEKRYVRKSGEIVWVRVNAGVVPDAAGAVDYRIAVIKDIDLAKLTGLALQALNTDLSGEAFLRHMTHTLTTLLGVEIAFVGAAGPASAHGLGTRAACVDGEFVADFSYELAGTPCEVVAGNTLCIFEDQVQRQFPGDALLASMGIESYAAVPLGNVGATDSPLGVLAVMSRRPLRQIEAVRTLLPLLALRVGAELVREREAQKFRDLFDGSPSAVFLVDAQGTIRMSSRAGERLFGWEPQALLGQKLDRLFPAEYRDAYQALFRRFVAAEHPAALDNGSKDIWFRRRDGSAVAVQAQLRILETAEGRMTVAHVQDITERKRSEQELRASQVLHTMAGRVAQLGGWSIELADMRLVWSDIVAEIHGEPAGFSPSLAGGIDYFVPEHRDIMRAAVERCLADGTPYDLELEKISAQGRRFWARTMGEAERDAQGRIVRIQGAFQEITERKRDQDALRELNAELEARVSARTAELTLARESADQANRAKSAFLAAMSHEIRTPMNGVVGMIDVLEQSPLKPTQTEIVKTIRESAHALLAIVDGVLDFSKIEAGQFQVESEPVGVAAVVEGVCDTLGPLAGKKGVELTLFTDPAIPAQVLGDAARLRQVLLNLTGNAIKFSSAQGRTGRVSVRASVVESGVQQMVLEFSVADTGIGMDEEMLSRLFTPFTQADTGTTRRFGGTGLGLSISHGLVTLMGGAIGVRSEPGRGSLFTVRLPVALLPAAPEAEAFGLAGLCCLVLGGPQGPADDLSVYLAHSGAAVQRVPDLAAACRWFSHCAPGLWTVVIADTDDALDQSLAELRAVCSARPRLEARFVVIERGRRRGPRANAPGLVDLDRDVMHRSVFLKAVALAAGRVTASASEEPSFDAVTMPGPLSMREASAQGRLILVAEDNEINQKVLRQQLALLGFAAHMTNDGREALDCLRRRDYPLLLTDLHMPEMDGYELAVAIRESEAGRRRMPIVALTANALKGEARRCLALGMDGYMTKPVQLADLKAMLGKWLAASPGSAPHVSPPPAKAAPTPALDVRVLEALVGDDPQVIAELLEDFRVSAGKASTQMRAACQARQASGVEAGAHRLKSSARSVGALALGELCAQLEAGAQAGRLETLAQLWPRFEAEMAAVNEVLGPASQ